MTGDPVDVGPSAPWALYAFGVGLCQCLALSCPQRGTLSHRLPLEMPFSCFLPAGIFPSPHPSPINNAMRPPLFLPNPAATLCVPSPYCGERRTLDYSWKWRIKSPFKKRKLLNFHFFLSMHFSGFFPLIVFLVIKLE